MKRNVILWTVAAGLALALMAVAVYAADTDAVTEITTAASVGKGWPNSFKVYQITWTTATDGTKAAISFPAVKGFLYAFESDPGSTAPTDNYDVTITNSAGVDIMGAEATNRDTSVSERAFPKVGTGTFQPAPAHSDMSVNITNNSVNSATGTFYLYFTEKP